CRRGCRQGLTKSRRWGSGARMIQVGEYTVRECLRASKQAQVYRAQRLGDGVQVLIKSYPRETDQTPRARGELALLISIGMRAAPTGIEALEIGAWSVLVMEYVAGRDLAEILGEGPLETERFLELSIAITQAVAAVHAANVVHRDLKPRN